MTQPPASQHRPKRKRDRVEKQALRYLLASIVSFVANLGIVAGLHQGLDVLPWVAVAVAMATVTVMNFVFMRQYVFDGKDGHWPRQFVAFVASIAGFRVVEYVLFVVLNSVLGLPVMPVYAGVLVLSFVIKFVYFRTRVFTTKRTPAPTATAVADHA